MRRLAHPQRPGWQAKVEALGLDFHTIAGALYWDERAHYEFSAAEVDVLDDATAELHRLCLEAVEQVVRRGWFARYRLAPDAAALVTRSWERRDPVGLDSRRRRDRRATQGGSRAHPGHGAARPCRGRGGLHRGCAAAAGEREEPG